MDIQRARTLTGVLNNDAAVQNSSIGNIFDFVSLRGFQLDWTNGLRRDGLALAPFQEPALENIQRLDVLKGPSGLIAGFNNPGGTINYVTKRPTLERFTEITAEVKTGQGRYLHLDTGGKFSDDSALGYRVNVAIEDTGDFTAGDDLQRKFFSAAIDWQLSDELLVRFDMDFQDKSIVSQPLIGLAQDPNDPDALVLPPFVDTAKVLLGQPWARYNTKSLNVATRVDYWLSDNWLWITQLVYATNDRFSIFPDIYQVNSAGDVLSSGIQISPDEEYRTLSAQSFVSGTVNSWGAEHELVVGFSARDYLSKDGRWFALDNPVGNIFNPIHTSAPIYPEYPDPQVTKTTENSLFVSDIIHFNSEFYATLGYRYINYKKQQQPAGQVMAVIDDEVFKTPIIGINYLPTDNLSLYASYSEGAGEGSVAVVGSGAINEGQTLGSQESEQREIGIKFRFGKATYTMAIYEIEKMLEYHNKQSNYFVQDGAQIHRGFEFNINGELTDNLSVVASFSTIDAKLTKLVGDPLLNGNRAANVPKIQANAFFDYQWSSLTQLKTNLGVYYVGERQQNVQNTLSVPGYTRVDVGAQYQLTDYNTTLRVKVENLLDAQYWVSAGAKGVDWGLNPGRGRTVILSATMAF